jgi:hypothetical protein
MTQAEKQFLYTLVDDIEDLRASLGALVQLSNIQVSPVSAQDAKSLAKQSERAHYAELRKKIDELASK